MAHHHVILLVLLLILQQMAWSNVSADSISSDEESMRGINYGLVTDLQYQVQSTEEYWTNTFWIEILHPIWRNLTLDLCQYMHNEEMCEIVESLQNQVNNLCTHTTSRLDDLQSSLYETFPDESMSKVKKKATMTLNYASDITKHVSHSAIDKDMRLLQRHIKELGELNHDLTDTFHVHSLPFSSMMKHQVLDLDRLTKNIERNYEDLAKIADSLFTGLFSLSKVIALYLDLLDKFTAYENQHQHLNDYLYLLKIRKLSPGIAGPIDLKNMLDQVEQQLKENYPSYRLVHLNIDHYWTAPEVFTTRLGSNMAITLRLPITDALNWLFLYKIHVTEMPVPDQVIPHYTKLANYPEYLAINENRSHYAEINAEQVEECRVKQGKILHCPYSIPLKSVSQPSCALAIFLNNTEQVKALCQFNIVQGITPPAIQEISPTKLLLTNCSEIHIQCQGYNLTRNGSMIAVAQLGCKCSLTSGNFMVCARISDCDDEAVSEVYYPVNLPAVSSMGSHRMKREIHGNTLFINPQKFHLHEIKTFQHNYSNILADGSRRPLSLKKVAESVQKGELVFHTLAERMLNGDVSIAHRWWSKAALWDILNISVTTICCVCMAYLLIRVQQLQGSTTKEHIILDDTKH